jgi:dsDNA-specific endonuclease/ATPase MutS2
MDKNIDDLISEGEFLSGVIGKMHTEEHSFKSQIDFLNNEIKQAELKSAEDNDEIEKLLLENEALREKNPGEAEAEIDRLRRLIQEMQDTHNDLQRQLKEEMDREIHRLREFGTAMRNQLNLLQRESVVGAQPDIPITLRIPVRAPTTDSL